jgi:hypothetical protein
VRWFFPQCSLMLHPEAAMGSSKATKSKLSTCRRTVICSASRSARIRNDSRCLDRLFRVVRFLCRPNLWRPGISSETSASPRAGGRSSFFEIMLPMRGERHLGSSSGFLGQADAAGLIGNGRIEGHDRGLRDPMSDARAATHPSVAPRSCRNNDPVHV